MSKPKYHCALLHRILPLITRCETNQKVPRVESHNGYFCPTCKETYNHIGEYKVGALIGYRVHWTVRFDLHYNFPLQETVALLLKIDKTRRRGIRSSISLVSEAHIWPWRSLTRPLPKPGSFWSSAFHFSAEASMLPSGSYSLLFLSL